MPTTAIFRSFGTWEGTPTLPPGGTWVYFYGNDNVGSPGTHVGIAGGGSNTPGHPGYWPGFCWKLT